LKLLRKRVFNFLNFNLPIFRKQCLILPDRHVTARKQFCFGGAQDEVTLSLAAFQQHLKTVETVKTTENVKS
jgi:hypothetical protein